MSQQHTQWPCLLLWCPQWLLLLAILSMAIAMLPMRTQASLALLQQQQAAAGADAARLSEQLEAQEAAVPQAAGCALLQQQLAVEQQRVQTLRKRLAQRQQAEGELTAAQLQQEALTAAAEQLAQALQRAEREQQRLGQLVKGQGDDAAVERRVEELGAEAAVLEGAMGEQQGVLHAARAQESELQQLLRAAQADVMALRQQQQQAAGGSDMGSAHACEAPTLAKLAQASAELDQCAQAVQHLQREDGHARARLELAASALSSAPLTAPAIGSTACGGGAGGVGPPPRRLHECFTVRQPEGQEAQQLAGALGVIASSSLDVVVVSDLRQADAVMSGQEGRRGGGGSRLRIWPLAQLQPADQRVQQRQAAAALGGAGRVWLPLDCLDYSPECEPAVLRAFGGFVVAADDTVAAELVSCWGLSCVTLAGDTSHPGSLSGGWSPPGGGAGAARWRAKVARDAAAAAAAHTAAQLRGQQEQWQALAAHKAALESGLATAAELAEMLQAGQDEVRRVGGEAAAAAACVVAAEQQLAQLEAALQACLASRTRYEELCAARQQGEEGGAQALALQLQQELGAAEATSVELQAKLAAAEEQVGGEHMCSGGGGMRIFFCGMLA